MNFYTKGTFTFIRFWEKDFFIFTYFNYAK